MIWARMLAYITGTVDQELLPEERISGRREPDPESPNPRQVVVIRCRKSYVGGDRPPARTESLGRIGGCRETGSGPRGARRSHLETVGSDKSKPSMSNSP
jgi:hypothetical protein